MGLKTCLPVASLGFRKWSSEREEGDDENSVVRAGRRRRRMKCDDHSIELFGRLYNYHLLLFVSQHVDQPFYKSWRSSSWSIDYYFLLEMTGGGKSKTAAFPCFGLGISIESWERRLLFRSRRHKEHRTMITNMRTIETTATIKSSSTSLTLMPAFEFRRWHQIKKRKWADQWKMGIGPHHLLLYYPSGDRNLGRISTDCIQIEQRQWIIYSQFDSSESSYFPQLCIVLQIKEFEMQ